MSVTRRLMVIVLLLACGESVLDALSRLTDGHGSPGHRSLSRLAAAEPIRIRQTFVPADRPDTWPAGDWRIIPREELTRLVDAASRRNDSVEVIPFERAEFTATFNPLTLSFEQGTATLIVTPARSAAGPAPVPPASVTAVPPSGAGGTAGGQMTTGKLSDPPVVPDAGSNPRPEHAGPTGPVTGSSGMAATRTDNATDAASPGRPTVIPFEPFNAAVQSAVWLPGHRPAILGTDSRNEQKLVLDSESRELSLRWSQAGATRLSGAEFHLQTPPAVVTSFVLQVPDGWSLASSRGIVSQMTPAEDGGNQIWKVELGIENECRLNLIRPGSGSERLAVRRSTCRVNSRYVVHAPRVDGACEVTYESLAPETTSVDVSVSAGEEVVGVEQPSGAVVSWETVGTSAVDRARVIRIQVPAGEAYATRDFVIRTVHTIQPQRPVQIRPARPVGAVLLGGRLSAAVESPTVVQSWTATGLQQTDVSINDDRHLLTFQQFHPGAVLSLSLRAGDSRQSRSLIVSESAEVRLDQYPATMNVEVQLTARARGVFASTWLVPRNWEITSLAPVDGREVPGGLTWAVLPGSETHQRLLLELPDGFPARSPVRLRMQAQLADSVRTTVMPMPVVFPEDVQSVSLTVAIVGLPPDASLADAWDFHRVDDDSQADGTDTGGSDPSSRVSTSLPGDSEADASVSGSFGNLPDAAVWATEYQQRPGRQLQTRLRLGNDAADSATIPASDSEPNVPGSDAAVPDTSRSDKQPAATGDPTGSDVDAASDESDEPVPAAAGQPAAAPVGAAAAPGPGIVPGSTANLPADPMHLAAALQAGPTNSDSRPGSSGDPSVSGDPAVDGDAAVVDGVVTEGPLWSGHRPIASVLLYSRIAPGSAGFDLHRLTWRFLYPTSQASLPFQLPTGGRLLDVRWQGDRVAAIREADGWSVPVEGMSSGDELTVSYSLPSRDLFMRDTYRCRIPQADVTVVGFEWQTLLRSPFAAVSFSDELSTSDTLPARSGWLPWLFGPLARRQPEPVFNPADMQAWKSLLSADPVSTESGSLASDQSDWTIATATAPTLPESLTFHLVDLRRLRALSWFVLCLTCLTGVLLRALRLQGRNRIGLIWLSACVMSSALLPAVFGELVGAAVLGAVIATLLPRAIVQQPDPTKIGRHSLASTLTIRRGTIGGLLFLTFNSLSFDDIPDGLGQSLPTAASRAQAQMREPAPGTDNGTATPPASEGSTTARSGRPAEIRILVPYQVPAFPAPAPPEYVFILEEEFRLLTAAALSRPPSAPTALVTSALWDGGVNATGRANLDASFTVAVRGREEAEIALPVSARFLTGREACQVDGQAVSVLPSADGSQLRIRLVPRSGAALQSGRRPAAPALPESRHAWRQHLVTLSLRPSVVSRPDGSTMRLPVPRVANSRMSLKFATIPLAVTNTATSSDLPLESGATDFAPGPVGELRLQWRTGESTGWSEALDVDLRSSVEIYPTWLQRRTLARYSSGGTAVRRVTWWLPPQSQISRQQIQAPQLADIEIKPGRDGSLLTLQFDPPQQQDFVVLFAWQQMLQQGPAPESFQWAQPVQDRRPHEPLRIRSHFAGLSAAGGFQPGPALLASVDPLLVPQERVLDLWPPTSRPRNPQIPVRLRASDNGVTVAAAPEQGGVPETSIPVDIAPMTSQRTIRQTLRAMPAARGVDWLWSAELEGASAPLFGHEFAISGDLWIQSVEVTEDGVDRLSHWDFENGRLFVHLRDRSTGVQNIRIAARQTVAADQPVNVPDFQLLNAITVESSLLVYRPPTFEVEITGSQKVSAAADPAAGTTAAPGGSGSTNGRTPDSTATTLPGERGTWLFVGRYPLRPVDRASNEPVQLTLKRAESTPSAWSVVRIDSVPDSGPVAVLTIRMESLLRRSWPIRLPDWPVATDRTVELSVSGSPAEVRWQPQEREIRLTLNGTGLSEVTITARVPVQPIPGTDRLLLPPPVIAGLAEYRSVLAVADSAVVSVTPMESLATGLRSSLVPEASPDSQSLPDSQAPATDGETAPDSLPDDSLPQGRGEARIVSESENADRAVEWPLDESSMTELRDRGLISRSSLLLPLPTGAVPREETNDGPPPVARTVSLSEPEHEDVERVVPWWLPLELVLRSDVSQSFEPALVLHTLRPGERSPGISLSRLLIQSGSEATELTIDWPENATILSQRHNGHLLPLPASGRTRLRLPVDSAVHLIEVLWQPHLEHRVLKVRRSNFPLPQVEVRRAVPISEIDPQSDVVETHWRDEPVQAFTLIAPSPGISVRQAGEQGEPHLQEDLSAALRKWASLLTPSTQPPSQSLLDTLAAIQDAVSNLAVPGTGQPEVDTTASDTASESAALDVFLTRSLRGAYEPHQPVLLPGDKPSVSVWVVDRRLNRAVASILVTLLTLPVVVLFFALNGSDYLARRPWTSWFLIGLIWWLCLRAGSLGFVIALVSACVLLATRLRRQPAPLPMLRDGVSNV